MVDGVILKQVQDDDCCEELPQTHLQPQVAPVGVLHLHQINLPIAVPVLELFFAGDGLAHRREHFDMHQPLAIAAFGEAFEGAFLVLVVSRGHV